MNALISAYDKTGIVAFAAALTKLGWRVISSGGTAAALSEAGIEVTPVEEVTQSPEMLDGRVKTLHPRIHAGILADRSKPEHLAALADHEIAPIDLVVCNLYPFGSDPGVELIDIGGPAMVRAAAKNFGDEAGGVAVLVNPADYQGVLDELANTRSDARPGGQLGLATRRRLSRAAFAHTAAYDAAIVGWFDTELAELPPTIHLALEQTSQCRYGENPHQLGALYRQAGTSSWWDHAVQHSGSALSYLNYFDAAAAWEMAHDLGESAAATSSADGVAASPASLPCVVIVKHANPCGAAVALGSTSETELTSQALAHTYKRAYECDERSAFGGIVALNRIVDEATVTHIEEAAQADLIIAPGFEAGVVDRLIARRKNTRILEAPAPDLAASGRNETAVAPGSSLAAALALRQINGGWLAQSPARSAAGSSASPADWKVVTKRQPTEAELADAAFAWRVCGHVSSNAIVLAKDGTAVGIGAGQQNRVESAKIAAAKASGRAAGGACASDAFYPFPDGVEAAAEAGVSVVVQPGGAMRDEEIIATADTLRLAMLFTSQRQFKH